MGEFCFGSTGSKLGSKVSTRDTPARFLPRFVCLRELILCARATVSRTCGGCERVANDDRGWQYLYHHLARVNGVTHRRPGP